MSGAESAGRLLGVTQIGLGVAVLGAPRHVLGSIGAADDSATRVVARVLGIRLVGQGLVVTCVPRADVLRASAVVDVAHAASMVPVAVRWAAHRHAASVSGALAAVAAVAAVVIATRTQRTS